MALTVTAKDFFTQISKFEVTVGAGGADTKVVANADLIANMAGPMKDLWSAAYASVAAARTALMNSKDMTVLLVGRDGSSYWTVDVGVAAGVAVLDLAAFAGAVPGVSGAVLTIMHNTAGW
jgi:hypothetical protein